VASAFAIPSLGISDESGREVAEPIASVTKLMTAHLVLDDHPLRPGEAGPLITVSQEDVNLYLDDQTSDQSSVEVRVGEVLSEYQLLEGMLVGSANNFANMLAVFDAGSVSSFVAKMNAEAARLHMTQTHYADASGYMKTSVSTAASQLKVAARDVTNPVFDQIVDSSSVTLPVAGTVRSTTPFIGTGEIVGVKSGFTVVAGGCDVLALRGDVGGVGVEVLAAVTGDHVDGNPIEGAGLKALSVAQAVMSRVRVLHPVRSGERVGVAEIAASSVPVVSRSEVTVVGWPGQRVRESFDLLARPHTGSSAGFVVGRITVRVGRQESRVTVRTSQRLPTPTFWERVF
jgi:D-alanyl-D-alanine carboxypeptidase (penicillin-binding protein 5/6)